MGFSTPTLQRMSGVLGSYVTQELEASMSSMGGAVVHLDGDETIKGAKTFTASIGVNGVSYGWPAKSRDGVLTNDGKGNLSWTVLTGVGTVTAVGLVMPPEFAVSGSPVKFSGDFVVVKAPQPSGTVYAGPKEGSKGVPHFRRLDVSDVPFLPVSHVAGLQSDLNARVTADQLDEVRKELSSLTPIIKSKAKADEVNLMIDAKADASELREAAGILKRAVGLKADVESLKGLERRLEAAMAALRGEIEDAKEGKTLLAGATFTGTLTTADLVVEDGSSLTLGGNKGTRFGTGRGQKIGFYGMIPVSQPSGDIVTALANLGLVKDPTLWISDIVGLADRLSAIEQKLGG